MAGSWTVVTAAPQTFTAANMNTTTNTGWTNHDVSGARAALYNAYDPHKWYYENKWDVLEAAMLEFVPTSLNAARWMGKYRCMWCKKTGYTWDGCLGWSFWWGHRHGKNCGKRP
jgi:hypothetical protein